MIRVRSDGTGLDPIETAVLLTLRAVAPATGPHLRTSSVLEAVQDRYGFAPDDAYRRILALCRPWLTALRLIDFDGNRGGRGFEAADPRYTSVRLTALGEHVAAGSAREAPALPIGFVLGDTYKGGLAPPLDPGALATALRALATDRQVQVGGFLAAPAFPTRCVVEGDVDQLWNGERVRLRRTAVVEPAGAGELRITNLPPRLSVGEVATNLAARAGELGLHDVIDLSTEERTVIRVVLRPDRPGDVVERVSAIWGVTDTVDCAYRRPLHELLGEWIDDDPHRLDVLAHLDR